MIDPDNITAINRLHTRSLEPPDDTDEKWRKVTVVIEATYEYTLFGNQTEVEELAKEQAKQHMNEYIDIAITAESEVSK